ncbi:hypothetical protein GGQ07_003081 [Salinibacter ruber]|nr:hypothetical protein [Salinibacter ruber]
MPDPARSQTAASLHFARNKVPAANVPVTGHGQNNESQQTGKKQQTNPRS